MSCFHIGPRPGLYLLSNSHQILTELRFTRNKSIFIQFKVYMFMHRNWYGLYAWLHPMLFWGRRGLWHMLVYNLPWWGLVQYDNSLVIYASHICTPRQKKQVCCVQQPSSRNESLLGRIRQKWGTGFVTVETTLCAVLSQHVLGSCPHQNLLFGSHSGQMIHWVWQSWSTTRLTLLVLTTSCATSPHRHRPTAAWLFT